MKWLHLAQCDSTQKYLLQRWEEKKGDVEFQTLITTDRQLAGVGRSGNSWHFFDQALAFSFTLSPLEPATLTPLEIGLRLLQFFENEYGETLQLKWPNDLFNSRGEKCGGIIVNQLSPSLLAVGIGLNISGVTAVAMGKNQAGSVFGAHTLDGESRAKLPAEIYASILNERMTAQELAEKWQKYCLHLERMVRIESGNQIIEGLFKGIGPMGEALLQQANQDAITPVYSGSLYLID